MKIKIKMIIILILFSLFFSSAVPNVQAQDSSEIIKRVSSDIDQLNNLLNRSNQTANGEEVLQILKEEIPRINSHLDESIAYYQKIESETQDSELKSILNRIDTNLAYISSTLKLAEESIYNEDSESFEQAFANYDTYIENLNSAVRDLENQSGIVDYIPILSWSFWISLIISAILFIISRGNPLLPAEKLRNQFESALFKSSLWPFGGSALSYFWGLATPPGESYMIFWWPIVIGYFQFAKGLFNYIKYARPAINLAKIEQQKKLESLLVSDEFQHSNMKEKLEEIEKLKPVHKVNI